jgi:hypothetical protein
MANGDLAASVGIDTVAGSADIRQGYSEVNKTRDEIAKHRLSGSHSAAQITSGTLAIARGGTGTGNPYGNIGGNPEPHPTNQRILVVDSENVIRAASGDIQPEYLGYRVHFTTLPDVEFDDGQAVEPHGAPFTPTEVIVQGLLTAAGGIVVCTARADNVPANSENVFLRAHNVAGPYDGTLTKIVLLCLRAA